MFGLKNICKVSGIKLKWWQTLYWWAFIAVRYPFSKKMRREVRIWKILYKYKKFK